MKRTYVLKTTENTIGAQQEAFLSYRHCSVYNNVRNTPCNEAEFSRYAAVTPLYECRLHFNECIIQSHRPRSHVKVSSSSDEILMKKKLKGLRRISTTSTADQ